MNTTKKTSEGTFFNKIGVADMERIHSAVIGWMLSDECMAFDIAVRSKLLNALFGYTDRRFTKIESLIEWKDIDILFLTEDSQGNKDCWIIENKIKTSQHSNQLTKYECIIINNDYPNSNKNFAFLTLIGETAASKNNQWINVTYHRLVQLLYENLNELQDNADAIILKEYYHTIRQLDDAAMQFITYPQQYDHVFMDGAKSKEMKQVIKYEDETSRFIGMNNLETIFQKMYFAKVINEVLSKCSVPYEKWHVGETRGNADFAIHFYNYPNAKKEDDFHFDISFQAGTFKFAISRSYWDKGTSQEYIDSVLTWKDDFVELQKAFPEYSRFNNAKSRARISISKNLKTQDKKWYKMNRETFVELVKKEFEIAEKMRQFVIDRHEKRILITNSL